jgi:ABC-type multidrug transport system ATPase subunit
MKILLNNASKKYNRQWIFKSLNYTFEYGGRFAILGQNGSGKSTLLQCIAGAIQLSKGSVIFTNESGTIEPDEMYQQVSFAAPYLDLIEEMTLLEHLQFHKQLRRFKTAHSVEEIMEIIQLKEASNKQIQHFSSGMKQRLKLGLAFFTQSKLVCLDEPLTNLDKSGVALYNLLLEKYLDDRTLIISSNDPQEYAICTEQLFVNEYKA